MSINRIFKPYVLHSGGYTGGKGIGDVISPVDKVYKLSSNENPLGPSPLATAAIVKNLDSISAYPDGNPKRLYKALSAHYKHQLSDDCFIAANGGSEIIDFVIRGFMGEEHECIVSNPCFMPYIMFSTWSGGKIVDIPLKSPDFSLDIDGILSKVNSRTRLIFLTSPNNPTGTIVKRGQLETLLHEIPEHVLIVYDEVYHHFTDDPNYTIALPYVKAGRNIIGINSFSKAYGLASLRLGYGYTTPEISHYLRKLCKPFLINQLSLEAGIRALSDKDHIEKTIRLIQNEKVYLYKQFSLLKVKYWKTQANFILIKPPVAEKEFVDFMIQRGIMVRPAGSFGAPGHVRVTIGTREANEKCVEAIQSIQHDKFPSYVQ